MTRAKEMLLLSGGITARSVGETVFELLRNIGTGEIGDRSTEALTIGASSIPQRVVAAPERKRPRRRMDGVVREGSIDPQEMARLWEMRTVRWKKIGESMPHLTPTGLDQREDFVRGELIAVRQDPAIGRLVGVVTHRLLEQWDFSRDPSGLSDQVGTLLRSALGQAEQTHAEIVEDEVKKLLTAFGRSEAYARLQSSHILGREVPFIMPWGERQVMEGVMDLLYRVEGELWIADYKTDGVSADQAAARAERYRTQSEVYKAAAKQGLGAEPRFHCLFLRCGVAIEL
jgi:ATP-dependent helicase/nuclease subunit A